MSPQHYLITGGTGFVGRYLSNELLKTGNKVTHVTRQKNNQISHRLVAYCSWEETELIETLSKSDIVVNLVGENIIKRPWTQSQKQRLYDSRVLSTRKLINALNKTQSKPKVLITASAIGYYGAAPPYQSVSETTPPGTDFLARLCIDWESEAQKAQALGLRVVIPRFGLILSPKEGVFPMMKAAMKWGLGGHLGDGSQSFPWVHIHDVATFIIAASQDSTITGPYNVLAQPNLTHKEFCKALSQQLHRPSWLHTPAWLIRLILGQRAQLLLDAKTTYTSRLKSTWTQL